MVLAGLHARMSEILTYISVLAENSRKELASEEPKTVMVMKFKVNMMSW